MNEPFDNLRLFDEFAVLFLYFRVQVTALAEQHDYVKVAIDLEGLLVRDNVRMFEGLEELGFLLSGELVSL